MSRRAAFAIIALLALAMFARPLVRGEVLTFRDHSDYFQPLRYFTAVELRHFRLPLWNPYNASGEPWLANPQTAVFYPPFWIFQIFPFAQAYMLFLWLHLVLLGSGAFLLFERFASPRAAFLGAIALMLCGPTLSMLDIQNNLTTFAWIPIVLWCALAEAPPMAGAAGIALSFLAGEPFFAAVGALLYLLAARRSLRAVFDVAVTSFCLAGIVLIPFLAMIGGSDRAGRVAPEEILRDSMPWSDWLRLVVPGLTRQQFIPIVYIGIVPALLAIGGIASIGRVRAARWWLLLVACVVVLAAGAFFAPAAALFVHSPVTFLRYPARVVPLGALAISALAAIGFDRFMALVKAPWVFFAAIALIIADVVPHIAPLLHSAPFDVHAVPYSLNVGRGGKIIRIRQPERGFDRAAWISGYLNLFERRYDAWTAAPVISESYLRAYETALRDRRALDAMSIEFVIERGPRGMIVERNPETYPLAYFRDASGRITAPSSLAFTTSGVFMNIDALSDGVVVVTQQNAQGWDVDVDRAAAMAERDGVFRAVRVTRGHHEIVWRYHPRSFAIGIALTILGCARMLLEKFFVKREWHKKLFSRRREFS
ncbi:MAG TPA: hypothetical protein VL284_05310 [Thermoanaerobaculia bacterium]|nr:hypothetical protein [Thermoanaerobaculia bacterium]